MTSVSVQHLYERYGPMVLRRCRFLLRDESAALDAMQDVFVQVLRYHKTLDTTRSSALLFRMATNVCLNRLRGRRRAPQENVDDALMVIVDDFDREAASQARSVLAKVFADEPETTATIAVLHWVDGMTWDEVATELKMSVSGVRKRARRLMQRVQSLQEQSP